GYGLWFCVWAMGPIGFGFGLAMAEIGCNWARIGPSKSSQSLSNAHKWAVVNFQGEVVYTTSLSMVCEVFCMREKNFNPTHAYYNGSRTSQDKEDPSWSTSIKTRRQRRHLQHWKRLGCHFILLYLYLLGTLFSPTIRNLLMNKEKLLELAKIPLNENCSAMLLKKLPEKLGDPGKFLIPCDFPGMDYAPELLGFSNSSGGNPTPTSETLTSEFILEEIEAYLKDDSISPEIDYADCNPEEDICLIEKLLNNDPFQLPPMDLKQSEVTKAKSSIEEPPELELKDLPSHLEYAYLEENNKLPVIIAKGLNDDEKDALLKVLKSHKRAIAWKITDIKGINPRFCTHKILMEDDYKPTVQSQRRVNPKIHEVIKKEVLKLLDARMIYPISDSPWVSPVHCVPKKGRITVVSNEENELILTRLVTGWRVCIDYRKLNEATRKDHFPLPFMDQMLERLAGNEFYCFLDGFLGYFQIPIDPQDQEKTTFTSLYGTFAYRRMPFGLCNAPGTFQRCMMAIFHDMIEKTMEVFMDDFSVFGDSFDSCLSNLEKMLKRCEDTNLVLNWEKCHFMCREGIVLGHKISKSGIKVDRAKVEATSLDYRKSYRPSMSPSVQMRKFDHNSSDWLVSDVEIKWDGSSFNLGICALASLMLTTNRVGLMKSFGSQSTCILLLAFHCTPNSELGIYHILLSFFFLAMDKYDMGGTFSALTQESLGALVKKYCIPLDLRRRLPDPNLSMNHLPTDSLVMSIYNFMTLPSWDDAKVVEEPHGFVDSILQRVENHTTAPATEGALIPKPTPKEIIASQSDFKLAKNLTLCTPTAEHGDDAKDVDQGNDLSETDYCVYLEGNLERNEGIAPVGVAGKAQAEVMDLLAQSALARDREYDNFLMMTFPLATLEANILGKEIFKDPSICMLAFDRIVTLAELERTESMSLLQLSNRMDVLTAFLENKYLLDLNDASSNDVKKLMDQLAEGEAVVARDMAATEQLFDVLQSEVTHFLSSNFDGLVRGCAWVTLMLSFKKVSKFVLGAQAEFDKAIANIPFTHFPFLAKISEATESTLSEVASIQPDKIARPAVSASAPATSFPTCKTFGWTSTPKASEPTGLAHDASPS
ncbi:reverse transcriptase domain-containing protein, partial [Tanacetum coccineum]